jgi:hypothetical protein
MTTATNIRCVLLLTIAASLACQGRTRSSEATLPRVEAPVQAPAPLRFASEHVSYMPLPGWTDRHDGSATFQRAPEGEVFQLSAPLKAGVTSVALVSRDVPADTDPLTALRTVSDAWRGTLAKGRFSYSLIVEPRAVPAPQGITGGEMYERWEIDGRWQRDAQRVFIRNGRAYLLRCDWADELGDDPPDVRRALDGLQFEL